MAPMIPRFLPIWSAVRGYCLAIGTVTVALFLGLFFQYLSFNSRELPLFLFAVALTSWYTSIGPALLSIALSTLAFDYFFTEPLYSFALSRADIPSGIILLSFAFLITWFSMVRKRIEKDLVNARDKLQMEVIERTRQASLLNLTHDTIFVRDLQGMISYWNRGAEELYGWTAQDAIGKNSHELLRTEFPSSLEEINDALFRSGRWEGELIHTKSDDTRVTVASRWALQIDDMGKPVGTLETNNDITIRKLREEEVRELNRELLKKTADLEGSNKELEAFAYTTSHDLRAPLRHVAGFAELLSKHAPEDLDGKCRRYIVTIQDAAKRMGNLIDDLLAFSRIGRMEAQMTTVNLDHLVREVLNELKAETADRHITWAVSSLPDCYGDRSMLRLVVANLLSNAVKFTRTRPHAVIEIGGSATRDGLAEVFVKDNGVGFNMKYVDKLFGVFHRLHSSDTFPGTGIGLATVQRIVHRHGGTVRAEAAVDQGATFTFFVSRHPVQ